QVARSQAADTDMRSAFGHAVDRGSVVRKPWAKSCGVEQIDGWHFLGLRVIQFSALREDLAILRPHRIVVGKRRRIVADHDDYPDIRVLYAIRVLIHVDEVRTEEQRAAKTFGAGGVKNHAMFGAEFVHPVVLLVTRRRLRRSHLGTNGEGAANGT